MGYENFRVKGRFAGTRRTCDIKRCHGPAVLSLGKGWPTFDLCTTHARNVIGLPSPAAWL